MKRWLWYLAAAGVILLLPQGQGTDIGKLKPVELLYIYKDSERIAIETDTGDAGYGYNLDTALYDLRRTAAGEIFLDTVDYLLVTEETKALLPELEEKFRLSTNVVLAAGPIDPQTAAEYLSVQKPEGNLKDCTQGKSQLPKMMTAGERYSLETEMGTK